ncbi:Late embryogenesis abundant protein [Parasponia andersonii]|uniref:Late embryogenesis abundant protein n=1 Tax=Parasponia andersonii TaxID=3476 RepID=A0A2P5AC14_PARAD|nr:Late embryogenesis abundant protein [Parasponia andersonii]
MLSAKSESDITSLAPSSPSRSPKRPVYYVQSPSRDSHDGDKSSSMQATPIYNNSPMESPSHSSFGRHSRNSSASRFSGIFRSSSGRKGGGGDSRKHQLQQKNDKGWPECNVILEEGSYDDFGDRGFSRRVQALIALFSFFVLFTVFCLIIWGASRPFKAEITVKSLAVHNLYVGSGTDFSGVPTKMLTVNGTLRLNVYNPATIFGIHVSSTQINLVYSEITVATGQLKKYFQPRKSHRNVVVNLEGSKVPLYGAGSTLTVSPTGAMVPLTLKFEIRSRGNVVGKLVRTKHKRQISCSVVIDSTKTNPIKFKKSSCTYD